MTEPLDLSRIVLGPREGGRGFGVIATSVGAVLSSSALAAVEEFNLGMGDHVVEDVAIHACFPLVPAPGPDLWFASTTQVHGVIAGNVVWVTWGVLLTEPQMDRIGGRAHRLFGTLAGRSVPALGEVLPDHRVDVGTLIAGFASVPASLEGLRYSAHLGHTPLAVAVRAPADVLATIDSIVEPAPAAWRRRLAVVTAPVRLRAWDLVCYDEASWRGRRMWLPAGAKRVVADADGLSGGDPAPVYELVWAQLVSDLEAGAVPMRALAALLDRHRINSPDVEEQEPAAVLAARFLSALGESAETQGGATAVAHMETLLTATSDLNEITRAPAARAALKAWERMFGHGVPPAAWFATLASRGDEEKKRLALPEWLLPRIAVEKDVLFDIPPQALPALVALALDVFPAALIGAARRAPIRNAETETLLLSSAMEHLDRAAASDSLPGEQIWEIATGLAERVICVGEGLWEAARDEIVFSSRKLVVDLLELTFRMRRPSVVAAIFGDRNRPALQRFFGATDFMSLVTAIRAAAEDRLAVHDWEFAFVVHEEVR